MSTEAVRDGKAGDKGPAEQDTKYVLVGKITAAYGIQGWVKVYSHTSPMEQILKYKPWLLKKGSKSQVLKPVKGKTQGKGLVARLEGFEDRNQAEAILGYEVWVDRSLFADLEDGEFYWDQLEGLKVFNQQEQLLGQVSHLIETGANDVLVLKATPESIDDKERLIPFVEPEIVLQVDLLAGSMRVNWDADY